MMSPGSYVVVNAVGVNTPAVTVPAVAYLQPVNTYVALGSYISLPLPSFASLNHLSPGSENSHTWGLYSVEMTVP